RPDGFVVAAVGLRAAGNLNALHVIDPNSGTILASSPGPAVPNALAMDTATGDVLIGDDTTGQVLRSTPSFFGYSTPTLVTTCPVQIDGIAIRPALSTFGAGSGPSAPNWITEPSTYGPGSGGGAPPNPGIPNVGNASFGLSIITSYALLGSPCLFAI